MSIRQNVSLLPYNSFGVQVHAKYFAVVQGIDDLREVLSSDTWKNYPHFILGGGSNVLFLEDYNGVVLHLQNKGIEVQETSGAVLVSAAAGEVWDELVAFCVQKNWGGLENLSLIPGTVGAAPFQNIGAYGVEAKDCIQAVEAYDLEQGSFVQLSPEECRFEYRDSLFKSHAPGRYLIWKVHFVLKKSPHEVHTQYGSIQEELNQRNIQNPTIADIREVVCHIRQGKLPDPKKLPNGGSFFKNPVVTKVQYDALKEKHPNLVAYPSGSDMKLAAGWLIDNLGWKGKRMGKVGVHDKQALVLVNYEDGSGKDIYDLSQAIIQEVSQAYDVELEREVRVVTSS